MNGKLVTAFLLTALIVSACNTQAQAETAMPTQAATSIIPITGTTGTATAAPTETSAATPTVSAEPTSTPEPPRPTNAPDCTNSAVFVSDVNYPDNSEVVGGTAFTKTWRVQNTGTCIWASDYTLTPYSGEQMSAPASVPLALTYPGQNLDISLPLIAPSSIGTHKGYFVIKNPAGLIMKINSDSRLWIVINVTTVAAMTATSATGAVATSATAGGTSGNGFAVVACAYTQDSTRVDAVVNAVNTYRAQLGLPAFAVNPQLTLAAQAHANDMACNHLFVHTGSNGSTVASRVVVSGYVASSVSENVYGSYPPLSGAGTVDWWKNDKTDLNHNLNLISDKYVDIGVGYAFFDNYGYYVIVFATP